MSGLRQRVLFVVLPRGVANAEMLSLTARRRLVRRRPEGVATIARSRVCGTSRPVAESTGDMPISAVSAQDLPLAVSARLRRKRSSNSAGRDRAYSSSRIDSLSRLQGRFICYCALLFFSHLDENP